MRLIKDVQQQVLSLQCDLYRERQQLPPGFAIVFRILAQRNMEIARNMDGLNFSLEDIM